MQKKPTHLPVLRMVEQRGDNDCGVAALATYSGMNYEDVYHAYAVTSGKAVHKTGVTMTDIIAAASALGFNMSLRRRVRLDDDFGILAVKTPKRKTPEHVVVLYEGHIYDTDRTVWEAEDFLKAEGWNPKNLRKGYTSIIKLDARKRR